MRIGTIFLDIENVRVAGAREIVATATIAGEDVTVPIGSVKDLDDFAGRVAVSLGKLDETVGTAVFASSSLDFPEESGASVRAITLANALRGEEV